MEKSNNPLKSFLKRSITKKSSKSSDVIFKLDLTEKPTNLSKGFFNWTFLAVISGAIILVNIIGSLVNGRIDMTEDKRYSLTPGTIKFLEGTTNLSNRISLKIYLEGELPADIKHFRNTLEAKLKEFKELAGDRLEYTFINPNNGTENEQQALFESLYAKGKGITPMDIVYMENGKQSQLMLWPGATIDYGGTTMQSIQFLPGTPPGKPYYLDDIQEVIENSVNNLEYMLISSLRRITQVEKPRIAFLQGHGELSYAETQRARALLAPYYNIADITIRDSLNALTDVDGLIIARPKSKFDEKELYIIDQYLMRGGRIMCFLDALHLDEDSLNKNGQTHTTRYSTGLERMLFDYGLKLNDNLVIDGNCAPKPVPFSKQSLIPWYFHVLATPTNHPIARNLEPVSLKYSSEIQFVGNSNNVLTPILTSSTNSNVTGLAPLVNLAMYLNYPTNELIANPTDTVNKRCLAGLAEGNFESYYRQRIVEEYTSSPLAKFKEKSVKEGKVLLVGNGSFIANAYDSMPTSDSSRYQYRPKMDLNDLRMVRELAQYRIPLYIGNQEFLQNMVDYMLGDNSVLDIRSRQIDIHELDKEKIKNEGTFYKVLNILLPIVIILLLATAMYTIRKRKYIRK